MVKLKSSQIRLLDKTRLKSILSIYIFNKEKDNDQQPSYSSIIKVDKGEDEREDYYFNF